MLNFIDSLQQSYFFNGLVLGTFALTLYLVITDSRFTFNRKLLFLLLISLLLIISYYIQKAPHEIIKELFWFSVVLNSSFIFHTLILDRLFHYCWKNHYEYLGFLISRISFTLSLSGLNYFIDLLKPYLFYLFSQLSITLFKVQNENANKNNFFTKYAYFYENYIQTNLLLKFVFNLILNITYYSTNLIQIICINFSIVFVNYSLILLGKQKKDFNKYIIINYLLQFIVLLIISWLIGYPRLYIIWFIQAIIECVKIFNLEDQLPYRKEEFQKLNFLDKIKYTYHNYKQTSYLINYYERKYKELEEIYDKPYHQFFMFDLCKFNFYGSAETKYSKIFCLNTWGETEDDLYSLNCGKDKGFFPINHIYKFFKWEEMAKGYIQSANTYWQENCEYHEDRDKLLRISEALYWVSLINKNQDYLNILIPDLIIEGKELELAKELLNKFYE